VWLKRVLPILTMIALRPGVACG